MSKAKVNMQFKNAGWPMPLDAWHASGRGLSGRRHLPAAVRAGVLCLALSLGACATKPEPPPPPPPAPKVEGLPEYMHQAETALAEGDKDKAREAYRSAARAEPTSKVPWLKLSESYFEGGDYGNAVLAAQEVLHRDNNDGVAAGILAVSGLRVSTAALAILRQQNNISPGTRGEAQTLTQLLRDLVGEQVLVPRPDPSPPPEKRPRPRVRPAAAASAPLPSALANAPKPPAPNANPPVATRGAPSPFDSLK